MKRLPNLDEQESGHTTNSAYIDGQMDILDFLDAFARETSDRLVDGV